VDSLASKGYVERLDDPGDRRANRVCLTPSGGRILSQAGPVMLRAYAPLATALPPDVWESLRAPLKTVFDLAKSREGNSENTNAPGTVEPSKEKQ
jgi:DNA-binding MarR family transcriptional regulator